MKTISTISLLLLSLSQPAGEMTSLSQSAQEESAAQSFVLTFEDPTFCIPQFCKDE